MKHFLMIFMGILLFAAMLTADAPNWVPVPGFQNSMVLISTVNLNSIPFTGEEGNMVGVFGPDGLEDCRGTGAYDYDYNFWYIDIAGTESELLSFKIYSSEYDEIADCNETMPFQINGIIGSPAEPYTLTSEIVAVDMSLLDIMRANELHTNSDGSVVIDPCAPNQDDVLVVVRNWSNYTIYDFDVMLTNVINGVPSGGVGTFTYVEHVESIPANGYYNAEFDISGDFVEPTYEYHTGTNPYVVDFRAIVDCNNDIGETNEDNNDGISNDSFLLLDNQKPNNYGWCVNDMDGMDGSESEGLSGTFGEGRSSNHFHNGIDIVCESEESVYSISSGMVEYIEDENNSINNYVRVTGRNNSTIKCRHIYLHTTFNEDLEDDDYVSSGTYIADEAYPTNDHVHFKDMSGANNIELNPLRLDGLINTEENSAPLVEELRAYPGMDIDPRPDWGEEPLFSSDGQSHEVDFLLNPAIDIVAHADDKLGEIGATQQYRYGIYKIGYQLWRFDVELQDYVLEEDKLDNFVFDDGGSINDSYYNYAYATGTCDADDYHIVTNCEGAGGCQGKIDLNLYTDGDFRVLVVAEDVRGNSGDNEIFFTLINHATACEENLPETNYILYLDENIPNPFNPVTTIYYNLPKGTFRNEIDIYNSKGQKVKSYNIGTEPGRNSINWNGNNDMGKNVASGMYFYTLRSDGKIVDAKKMTLLK